MPQKGRPTPASRDKARKMEQLKEAQKTADEIVSRYEPSVGGIAKSAISSRITGRLAKQSIRKAIGSMRTEQAIAATRRAGATIEDARKIVAETSKYYLSKAGTAASKVSKRLKGR